MSCGSTSARWRSGAGIGPTTQGFAQLRELLGGDVEVVVVPLPHYRGPADVFHLMSIISPVDRDLAVVYSPLMPVPFREWLCERGIRFVEVPDDEFESMGTNVLARRPRRCVMVDGNPVTRARLEAAGAEVRDLRRIGDQPEGWRRPDVPDAAAGARIAAAGNQRIRSVSRTCSHIHEHLEPSVSHPFDIERHRFLHRLGHA